MPGHPSIAFLLLSLFLFSAQALAESEDRGRILKASGEVHVIDAKGEARKVDGARHVLRENDTVVTREGGTAVVRLSDGALSVLDEKSSLRVEKNNWLSHIGGKIYFTFRKFFGEPRRVETRFSTIGVRGTTFIVTDSDEAQAVALQEGELELESPGEAYEIHRQKELDDFETYKQQVRQSREAMMREYADYKKQVMQEFVEYKKSFTLGPDKVVRFDGRRVDESDMDEDTRAEFGSFESIAGDMLEQFRQESAQHRERTGQGAADYGNSEMEDGDTPAVTP